MFSRVDAGAVGAFSAMFTIKKLPLWIDQVAADTHATHTQRDTNINTIRFSSSSFTLARLLTYYLLSIVSHRQQSKRTRLAKMPHRDWSLLSFQRCLSLDVLNGAFLVLPEELFAL